jgi:glutaconate CoA-transferase subunit A
MTYNPDFKTVTSPYADGEVLLAMPALNLDVSFIHVNRADRLGNTQIDGPDPYFDDQFARAAERCFVTAEEIVDRMDLAHPDTAKQNLFERYLVTGVVHAPYGAHPTSFPPMYGWDMTHLKAYAASAAEDDGWAKYVAEFVKDGEAAYLEKVGGAAKVAALPLPVF